jgi:hypothetical protein
VAERDAFGREIGEAPQTGATTPVADPVPESVSEPGEPRDLGPAARTVASLVVALLIVAGITAAVIVGIGGKEDDSSSGSLSVGSNIELPTASSPEAPAKPTKPAKPAAPRSLIGRSALAGAMRRLRGRGRLRLLRVAPDRVDAQLVTRDGRLRNVQVSADGALHDFGPAGSGAGGLPTIPFAQVDVGAPGRIVRAAARRAGRKPARVDYLVLLKLPTGLSWNVYFKPDGLHFMADGHGAGLVKP